MKKSFINKILKPEYENVCDLHYDEFTDELFDQDQDIGKKSAEEKGKALINYASGLDLDMQPIDGLIYQEGFIGGMRWGLNAFTQDDEVSSIVKAIREWVRDYENKEDHDGEFNVLLKDDAYLQFKRLLKIL